MRISISAAADLLKHGHVVAVPTETVYGLAAALHAEEAIAEIFKLKNRPSDNPLIIHVSSLKQIEGYATAFPPDFEKLAEAFWPGPMTIVLPIDTVAVPSIARAGLSTAAFRIPSHPIARQVIESTGPIVMPSANISGRPSATSAEHVENDFGAEFPVLDGGACRCGMESTILIYVNDRWAIIRLGSLAPESFFLILGYEPEFLSGAGERKPICPGQLYRHYAPKAKLSLLKEIPADFRGAIIGFSDRSYSPQAELFALGPSDLPAKVAENLYAVLRDLDYQGVTSAVVDLNFPHTGLWTTIRERLQKAASLPREG